MEALSSQISSEAQAAYSKAHTEGFFNHFSVFHEDVKKFVSEFMAGGMDAFVAEAKAIVTFTPTNAAAAFSQVNALALFVATLESAVLVLLGEAWLVTLVKVALGYATSYTMYWSVLCSSNKALMNPALAFLLGFVIYNVCRAWQTLFFIITPALCILKAGLAALQLVGHSSRKPSPVTPIAFRADQSLSQ